MPVGGSKQEHEQNKRGHGLSPPPPWCSGCSVATNNTPLSSSRIDVVKLPVNRLVRASEAPSFVTQKDSKQARAVRVMGLGWLRALQLTTQTYCGNIRLAYSPQVAPGVRKGLHSFAFPRPAADHSGYDEVHDTLWDPHRTLLAFGKSLLPDQLRLETKKSLGR